MELSVSCNRRCDGLDATADGEGGNALGVVEGTLPPLGNIFTPPPLLLPTKNNTPASAA